MAGIISKALSSGWKYAKENPWSTAGHVGLNGFFGISAYNESREQGNGMLTSALKAGVELGYYAVTPMKWAIGIDLLKGAGSMAVSAGESANQLMRSYERDIRDQTAFKNYTWVDGPQVATMRQAGMHLAQRSKYQLQQALMGNEAQYMHK